MTIHIDSNFNTLAHLALRLAAPCEWFDVLFGVGEVEQTAENQWKVVESLLIFRRTHEPFEIELG